MKTALLLLAFIGNVLIAVNSIEFTLKKSGRRVAPNSVLNINTEIGRQYESSSSWYYSSFLRYTNDGPLVCHTQEPHCCRGVDDPIDNEERGEWINPNGEAVDDVKNSLYVTRGYQQLHLHAYYTARPTGVYCCKVQVAENTSIITDENANYTESACVGLYTSSQLRLCEDFLLTNGMVEYDSPHIPGRVASISCMTGYTLIGSSGKRTCTSSGWNETAPRCTKSYNCGPLSNPMNGQVDTSQGTTAGARATYSCNKGYRLIGSSTRYCQQLYYRRYTNNGWSDSAPICVDEALMQLRFSPTPGSCLEWDTQKVDTMRQAFASIIEKAIADHISLVLSNVSSDNYTHSLLEPKKSFFSCRSSHTDAHFRTPIYGLENVSAHEIIKAVQHWASTGPSVRIQWYVVDIDRSCHVAISSDVAPECVDSTVRKCREQ